MSRRRRQVVEDITFASSNWRTLVWHFAERSFGTKGGVKTNELLQSSDTSIYRRCVSSMLVQRLRMLPLSHHFTVFAAIRSECCSARATKEPNSGADRRSTEILDAPADFARKERSRSSDHFSCSGSDPHDFRKREREKERERERERERDRGVYSASDTFLTMPTRSFPIVINYRAYPGARFPIYSSGQPFYGEDARRFHRGWTGRAVSTSFPLASWRGVSLSLSLSLSFSLPERLYEYFPVDRPAEWNFPTRGNLCFDVWPITKSSNHSTMLSRCSLELTLV